MCSSYCGACLLMAAGRGVRFADQGHLGIDGELYSMHNTGETALQWLSTRAVGSCIDKANCASEHGIAGLASRPPLLCCYQAACSRASHTTSGRAINDAAGTGTHDAAASSNNARNAERITTQHHLRSSTAAAAARHHHLRWKTALLPIGCDASEVARVR